MSDRSEASSSEEFWSVEKGLAAWTPEQLVSEPLKLCSVHKGMEARLGDDNVQARGSKLILGTLEAYKTTLSAPKAKLEQAAEELRNAAAWAEAVPPLVEWILKPTDPIAAEALSVSPTARSVIAS